MNELAIGVKKRGNSRILKSYVGKGMKQMKNATQNHCQWLSADHDTVFKPMPPNGKTTAMAIKNVQATIPSGRYFCMSGLTNPS